MSRFPARFAHITVLAALVASLACAALAATEPDPAALTARVIVVPGKNWMTRMWIAFIPVSKGPQLAAWIETADGEYVATLTATARTAENEWRAAPDAGRPEALPVWNAARSAAGTETVDAASSATPEKGVETSRAGLGLAAGGRYVVRCEVNHSFDYNDTWPKKAKAGEAGYSGVNGQPSLVYEGRFVAGTDARVDLVPVGRGSLDGSSGEIAPGLDGMTSALSIIESIYVILTEE